MEEKERMLDFGMAHQSILFQVNKISSKVMVGHQKQNERAENQIGIFFKESEIS